MKITHPIEGQYLSPTEPWKSNALLKDVSATQFASTVGRRTIFPLLPQDGGVPQTSEQLIERSRTRDPRALELFGRLQQTNALEIRPEMRGEKPPGREQWLRSNDRTAIEGLDALVKNGTIDENTIVIIEGGHAPDGMLRLTDYPHLRAQGVFYAVFKQFEDPMLDQISGSYRALNYLDMLQTYNGLTRERMDSHGTGGAIVLGIDTHGTWPDPAYMPSIEAIRKVMGPNARVVVVNEMPTGREADPTTWRVPLQPWLQKVVESGIPVSVHGINSRGSLDEFLPSSCARGGFLRCL